MPEREKERERGDRRELEEKEKRERGEEKERKRGEREMAENCLQNEVMYAGLLETEVWIHQIRACHVYSWPNDTCCMHGNSNHYCW